MIINLTNPNGTKLLTGGKIVKEDITIIPNLPGGGGDCSEKHVIGVDTLPDDEAADSALVYFCGGKYYTFEHVASEGGTVGKWTEYLTPEGAVTFTANGTFNIAGKKTAIVNVPNSGGGGDCTRPHVIAVDTLPDAEAADENAVYFCDGKYYKFKTSAFGDITIRSGIVSINITEMIEGTHTFVIAPTKPTEGIAESGADGYFWYYIEDENDIFLYASIDGTSPADWASFSEFGLADDFLGVISDRSEASGKGYYALLSEAGFVAYRHVTGALNITANGEDIDVADFEKVTVDIDIPTVNDDTLTITGVDAGSSRTFSTTEYYRKFALKSLPTEDITVALATTEKTYTATSGHVLNSVTVPAMDVSNLEIPCGLMFERFPKTKFRYGEPFRSKDGFIKVLYANGNSKTYAMSNGYASGVKGSIGEHTINVSLTIEGVPLQTSYNILVGDPCTFTINGATYGALDGITWQNWIESSFNYNNLTRTPYCVGADGYIWYGTECQILYSGNPIAATDTITSGAAYNHNSG